MGLINYITNLFKSQSKSEHFLSHCVKHFIDINKLVPKKYKTTMSYDKLRQIFLMESPIYRYYPENDILLEFGKYLKLVDMWDDSMCYPGFEINKHSKLICRKDKPSKESEEALIRFGGG